MLAFEAFLDLLRCPVSGARLNFSPVPAPDGYGHFGILDGGGHRYPVIDDIPVLMPGPVGLFSHWNDYDVHLGPTSEALVAMLERGALIDALIGCLVFPHRFFGQWRLERMGLWPASLGRRIGLMLTRMQLQALLARRSGTLCAEDLFRFFYGRRSGQNPFMVDYWSNRFVMPRYLSAMALIQRIGPSERPVLDIACGFGQFEHYLTRRRRRTPAIGCDFNFYQLWGARHFVAPDAGFVCCDAGKALPFADNAFSAAICSDAFAFMPDKPGLLREIERLCGPGAPAVIARVGNRDVGPPNPPGGGELRPDEYSALFGADRSLHFADTALWKCYLERRNPVTDEPQVAFERLRWEKYLSYAINPQALSDDGETDGAWCHGVGRLALNPALSIVADQGGVLATEFMFRSPWGGYEDSDMMAYTERWGQVDKRQLQQALDDPSSAVALELQRRFVLAGVPDRYLRERPGFPSASKP